MSEMRLWDFRYTEKEKNQNPYYNNKTIKVNADTLDEAVVKFRKEKPDVNIWQINHGGVVEIL